MPRPLEEILKDVTLTPAPQVKPAYKPDSTAGKVGGMLVGALQGAGNLVESGAKNIITPVAKAVAKPFLTAGANAVASGRGIFNLATGNIAAEQQAQAADTARGGVSLGALGTYKPATTPLEVAGTGAQIAATLGAGPLAKFGASLGAPAAATGLFAGGTTGLLHGLGTGALKAEEKGLKGFDAAGEVLMTGVEEGAIGAAAGYAGGTLADWWGKRPPALQKDEAAAHAAQKAKVLDRKTMGPGAADYANPDLKAQPATKSVQTLLKGGYDPNDLNDLSELSPEDLTAVKGSIAKAQAGVRSPASASLERVNEPVAKNVMAKIDKVEEIAGPMGKALRDTVKESDATINHALFSKRIASALPDDLTAYSDADRNFINKVVERASEVKDPLQAHDFRKWIASETDQYVQQMNGGKSTPGEVVAGKIRNAVGDYLDETVDGYGDLRRQIQPLLEAKDNFWRRVGGQWKNYEGDATNRKVSEFSRRLITNTSADTTKAVEMLDEALAPYGAVGGDVTKQQYYATQIERLYNVKPTGGFESSITSAGVTAKDLQDATTGGALGKVKVVGKAIFGNTAGGKRALDYQQEEVRQAFSDYVDALIKGSGQSYPGPGAAALGAPELASSIVVPSEVHGAERVRWLEGVIADFKKAGKAVPPDITDELAAALKEAGNYPKAYSQLTSSSLAGADVKERVIATLEDLKPSSQTQLKAFNESGGQKEITKIGSTKIVLGQWGSEGQSRKMALGKLDRFPEDELSNTLDNIVGVYRGTGKPNEWRFDINAVHSVMPNGENRLVFLRRNRFGDEEITGWHIWSLPYKALLEKFANGIPPAMGRIKDLIKNIPSS